MNAELSEQFDHVVLTEEQLDMYKHFFQEEPNILQVFQNIVEDIYQHKLVTVKSITDNLAKSVDNEEDALSRKMVEVIVKQLIFASFIYTEKNGPSKFIHLTGRGRTLAIHVFNH